MIPATTDAPAQPRRRLMTGAFIIGMGLVLSAVTVLSGLSTTPIAIRDNRDGATVFFEAEQNRVLLPFQCVTLRWRVENIWGVYLDEAGVIGQDTREWCVARHGTQATLRVRFPEDVWQDYTLTIGVTAARFELLVGVVLIVLGAYVLQIDPLVWVETQLRTRRGLTTVLIYGWITGILFLYWAVNGRPGTDVIVQVADDIRRVFAEFFTAPYQG